MKQKCFRVKNTCSFLAALTGLFCCTLSFFSASSLAQGPSNPPAPAWIQILAEQAIAKSPLSDLNLQAPTLETLFHAYCTLIDSKEKKLLSAQHRYIALVDYTFSAQTKRLFLYDRYEKTITHSFHTSHAARSSLYIQLSFDQLGLGETGLAYSIYNTDYAEFFSNTPGSQQSSVGLAIGDQTTYVSGDFGGTALRLTGVDGKLNSNLKSRAVVIHRFSAGWPNAHQRVPLSEGCLMFPDPTSEWVANALVGSPVFLVHERMNSKVNEDYRNKQNQTALEIESEFLAGLDPSTPEVVKNTGLKKIRESYQSLIEPSYQYFHHESKFWGKRPKNFDLCKSALQQ